MNSHDIDHDWPGFPIRKSTDQRVFVAPRGLSQLTTSFIAVRRQGIHLLPYISYLRGIKILDNTLKLKNI